MTVDHSVRDGELTVIASRFVLTSRWGLFAFFRDAIKVRKQVLASPGAVGFTLLAQPWRRTLFTLSTWRDKASLNAFVAKDPHRAAMRTQRAAMADSKFAFWTVPADSEPPTWEEAQSRLR